MQKKISSVLHDLDLKITGIVLGVLILYTFVAVIMRYFINRPIYWGEEFQLLCMVLIVFLGAGAGFRTGSHVAIDFLVDLFPWKVQRVIVILMYAFSMIIMAYFFIQSSLYVRQMFITERFTNIIHVPLSVIYAAFPIGCILIMVNYTIVTFFKYIKSDNTEPSE